MSLSESLYPGNKMSNKIEFDVACMQWKFWKIGVKKNVNPLSIY